MTPMIAHFAENSYQLGHFPGPMPYTPRMELIHAEAAGFRLTGLSVAGEESFIAAPELDVMFDVGRMPTEVLHLNTVALSHGHMDHAAGLAYYFSQRNFQDLPPGTVVCHRNLVQPINDLLDCWDRIEGHRSPGHVIGLLPGESHVVRKGLSLQTFAVNHHGQAIGFVLVEHRSKLKSEYVDESGQPKLTGPQFVQLKSQGISITQEVEIPLIAYCGDTAPGPFIGLDIVRQAKLLLLECTFFEPEHVRRAKHGRHLHVRDLPEMLVGLENEAVLLMHVTRRTPLTYAKRALRETCGKLPIYPKLEFLMDRRKWRQVAHPPEENPPSNVGQPENAG